MACIALSHTWWANPWRVNVDIMRRLRFTTTMYCYFTTVMYTLYQKNAHTSYRRCRYQPSPSSKLYCSPVGTRTYAELTLRRNVGHAPPCSQLAVPGFGIGCCAGVRLECHKVEVMITRLGKTTGTSEVVCYVTGVTSSYMLRRRTLIICICRMYLKCNVPQHY